MFYLFGKDSIVCLSCSKMCAFHENSDRIYTEPTLILKAHISKCCMYLSSAEIFEAFSTNSVDPDQTAPVGAV